MGHKVLNYRACCELPGFPALPAYFLESLSFFLRAFDLVPGLSFIPAFHLQQQARKKRASLATRSEQAFSGLLSSTSGFTIEGDFVVISTSLFRGLFFCLATSFDVVLDIIRQLSSCLFQLFIRSRLKLVVKFKNNLL